MVENVSRTSSVSLPFSLLIYAHAHLIKTRARIVSRTCVIVTVRRQFSVVLLDREFAHGSSTIFCYPFTPSLSCLRVAIVGGLRWESTGQIKGHRERTKHEMLIRAEGFQPNVSAGLCYIFLFLKIRLVKYLLDYYLKFTI